MRNDYVNLPLLYMCTFMIEQQNMYIVSFI